MNTRCLTSKVFWIPFWANVKKILISIYGIQNHFCFTQFWNWSNRKYTLYSTTNKIGNRAGLGSGFICFTMYSHSTKLSDKLHCKTTNKLYDNYWHNCKLNFDFIKFNLAYLKNPYYKILDLINSYIAWSPFGGSWLGISNNLASCLMPISLKQDFLPHQMCAYAFL